MHTERKMLKSIKHSLIVHRTKIVEPLVRIKSKNALYDEPFNYDSVTAALFSHH